MNHPPAPVLVIPEKVPVLVIPEKVPVVVS
jgi:hypothetical protein